MHRKTLTFLFLVASAGLATLPCEAQTQATMRLQFMTFPMTMKPLEVEMLAGEGQVVKLEIPSNSFSETVSVPRLSSLIFGKSGVDKEGKPTFDVCGKGEPTSASKQLVLLLRKGKEMSDGVVVRAIPGDIEGFGGGKMLFLNASTVQIGGRAGGQTFSIKPGKHAIVKPKPEPNGRLAYVEFFYNKNNKPVPFFNSMWPIGENNRGLIFFYNDPNRQNKINLHTYRDFLGRDQ